MKSAIREVIITILLALIFFLAIRTVVHNFEVQGISMKPTLQDGQFIIVSKAAYWFHGPERGDIVVFNTPRVDHGVIHRVVGLPDEVVEIRQGALYINGQKWEETYIHGNSIEVSPTKIPEGHYFIIGDNRDAASHDIVARKDIVGKAWIRYWPLSKWGLAPNHNPNPAHAVGTGD